MDIKITPKKLDGEITLSGLYAEYFNAASLIGNRVKVNGGKDIVKYLLSYNAKGTAFDLTEKQDYIPILSFCACFACSDTKITANNEQLIKETVKAITDMGGVVGTTDYGLIVCGRDSLPGGYADSKDCRVALAAALSAFAADSQSIIKNAGIIKEVAPTFFEDLSFLGGEYVLL